MLWDSPRRATEIEHGVDGIIFNFDNVARFNFNFPRKKGRFTTQFMRDSIVLRACASWRAERKRHLQNQDFG